VLGSTHFTREAGEAEMNGIAAMLNMDMIGRLRSNRLSVLGAESAAEWKELVAPFCEKNRVECITQGDGYGPSDHTPFYAEGGGQLGVPHLGGDGAVVPQVAREVHGGHAATAELALERVAVPERLLKRRHAGL
jgi:hypothetical protein